MKSIENKTRKIEEEYVNKKGVTKTRKIKEEYIETKMYYYSKNHLGSIVAITDENNKIVEEYVYDVFGKPYSKQEDGKITNLKKSPIGNTRLYTGREYDRGLKLYYNRARYYNPEIGRFISRDPIDISDDVNLYGYVGNNSVMFSDILGLTKSLTADEFRIAFVSAYDEFLIAEEKLRIAKLNLNIAYKEPLIFGKNKLIEEKRELYNTALDILNTKEDIAKELHYYRNKFNVDLPDTIKEAVDNNWWQPELINSEYAASWYHQNWNLLDGVELKFIDPDGHREIIFTFDGEEVTSDKYGGTYNIYSPSNFLHKKYDIDTYTKWGNGSYFVN